MEKYGVGPAAVRTIAGTMDLHLELERRLAAFKGVEAAITFQSGFTANLATIPALVGKDDAIFSDELNHASIIDGCRLSGGEDHPLCPLRPGDLERVLEEKRASLPARAGHHRWRLQHGRRYRPAGSRSTRSCRTTKPS